MTNNEVKNLKGAVSTYNQLVKRAVERGLLATDEGINKVFAGADKNKKCYVKLSDDESKALKDAGTLKDSDKCKESEETSIFGFVLMLTNKANVLNVKFAGSTYSITSGRNKNTIEFISGHGVKASEWNSKELNKLDKDAVTYYSKGDKALIEQYRFEDINVEKRVEKIYNNVLATLESEKANFIANLDGDTDEEKMSVYNELYKEYQKELEEKAEKAKQARENRKSENKAKKEEKAA